MAETLAIAGAYFVTAQLGLLATIPNTPGAFIWPPAGLAVAVLWRAGLRYSLGVFLGAWATELTMFSWWQALGIAAGSTSGLILAVVMMNRWNLTFLNPGRRELSRLILASIVGVTLSSINSLIWQAAGGLPSSQWLLVGIAWWLGDTIGILLVAPALLTASWPRWQYRTLQAALGLLVTALLSAIAFVDVLPVPVRALLLFPAILFLVYVGIREQLGMASIHVALWAAIALIGTSSGQGPFRPYPPLAQMLMLSALLTTCAVMVLALAATHTERDRAQAALAATAAEYQALVDSTPAVIVRYQPDGRLTFANETLCKLLGCERSALIGRSVFELIPNLPRGETVTELPLVHDPGVTMDGTSGSFLFPDGSKRWYRWTAKPITTAQGAIEFQAVGIDLTERREAEAQRAAIERKMQDAQRLEALGVLAGGVAHDFNNWMAGILGHAELALAVLPENHPAHQHLQTVINGVMQASGLTRQLLAYSGKGRFFLRTINLNELIVQTTDLLRLTLPKKVQLELQLAPELPLIRGDEGQLRQVLMNLIINAGEAIGDKPGTVTVSTTGHGIQMDVVSGGIYSPAAPGRFVELIVADTGCGMDESTRAKLFDPFFTTKFAGRGLGLSAVLGIVRGHGGGIRVESQLGVGTRFTVLLPALEESETSAPVVPIAPPSVPSQLLPSSPATKPERPPDSEMLPLAPSDPTPPPGIPQRGLALVADDEPTVRRVGELLLSQLGFHVVAASNGQEAVELFRVHAERVQLVLLDVTMPVMDGLEVLAAIRQMSRDVPVLLCSGYAAEAIPETATTHGSTGFLQKPFTRRELQAALAQVGIHVNRNSLSIR
ncbi:MAG: response regulator [Gemmataceae bacterium]|nr:response regulator [Gemmata sp.]MDW8198560.1 response regulator [Gemmataceae bacterium]